MAIIDGVELTKAFGSGPSAVQALRGVSLRVEPGELVAVMGPSGCGKSTLLHLAGGLDTPTSGTLTVGGERIDRLSEAKRAVMRRRTVGYVFQFFNLVANLSVADNIELPLLLAGRSPAAARQRREELLERLGLADQAAKAPGELSGGQQQRVAIARALANEPPLLLADEPTGALDSAAAAGVLDLLVEQHAAGRTVVLVTHDEGIGARAERIIRLRDGLIVADTRAGDEAASTDARAAT